MAMSHASHKMLQEALWSFAARQAQFERSGCVPLSSSLLPIELVGQRDHHQALH